MFRKKLIALLCAVVMVVSVLSGCGNVPADDQTPAQESSTKAQEANKEEATNAEESDELEFVELNWYIGPVNGSDVKLIEEELNEYLKDKLNCKINMICDYESYGDFASQMSAKLLGGELVDLVFMNGAELNPLALGSQGALYPLGELMEEYGPNVKALFPDTVWNATTVNGSIYGVPTLKDNCYIIGYIYNETLANALGLDLENTDWSSYMDMDELLNEALKLRDEKFPEYKGMPLIDNHFWGDLPFYFAAERLTSGTLLAACNVPGLEVDPERGADEVFNVFETDTYREMVLMRQRWVESGIAAYDYSIYETNVVYQPSTLIVSAWGYVSIDEHLYSDDFTSKLVVFDDIWTDASNYSTAITSIGAKSENPERAMMFLDLLNSDSYVSTLLHFGIENTHWEYDADGKIQLMGRNEDKSNAGWIQWYGSQFGNLTIVEGPESYVGEDGYVVDKIAEYNDMASIPPHMGFVLDTTEIDDEIAACKNVISEFSDLTYGRCDSAETVNKRLDEMIAKLKENGSDVIVQEAQRQLDEWIAANK